MQFLIGILICSVMLIMLQGSWLMVMDAEAKHKKKKEDIYAKKSDNKSDNHWIRLQKAYPALEKKDIKNG